MNYDRINNITGWAVFAIAFISYLLTMAPTASYWDCGEFIACANELEVPHPPGAPFFLMLGRVFATFAFGNVENIAFMLNLLSVLSSAFTVLFTVWITTHFGRRILGVSREGATQDQTLLIMAAGAVAGLVCTYADSFWFNAVEAEVYALSSFFTAVVVWLMVKWDNRADLPGSPRWIILIAYLMGLSMGVHLLNLLAIPALAFMYYFRKFDFNWGGFLMTGVVSVVILGFVQTGLMITSFDMAWGFEKVLVGVIKESGLTSGMGLPVGTGIILFFTLVFGAIGGLIYYTSKIHNVAGNTAMLSILAVYIGFSSYLMVPIRSNANPPIDENNPDDTQTFLSYMKREQYGDRPLLYGPLYNAQPIKLADKGKEYVLDREKGKYVIIGDKLGYEYADVDKKFLPRMYEPQRYNAGPHGYVNYVAKRRQGDPNTPTDDKPTPGEDMSFFFGYQVNHMYLRYFMWNFAGREGDLQDMGWESGLRFDQISQMPDFMKNHPSKNHYYMIPFLLGLLGLAIQVRSKDKDAIVVGLLFFFTGLAIIIYLNQYPNQPRERDYSFAGSFQTYAIWVGLGVLGIYEFLKKFLGSNTKYLAIGLGALAPILMASQNWFDHSRAGRYTAPDSAYNLLNSLAPNAIVFTNGDNDTFPLWYLQEVENVRPDVRVLCLSYVNTDWYIDQMKQKVNQSEPLPVTMPRSSYTGQAKQSKNMGDRANYSLGALPVNGQDLLAKGVISEEELQYVQSPMRWNAPTRGGGRSKYFELKDLLILNLMENIAKQGWERPIYFANTVTPSSFIGLGPYMRLEGLAYRVLPVKQPTRRDPYNPYEGTVDQERMYDNLVNKFRYRNLNNPNVYYDENIGRMMVNYHSVFYSLANSYFEDSEELKRENARLKANQEEEGAAEREAQIAANETEQAELLAKAKEVMAFTEEKFPYQTVTPDPFIIIRAGIMWDRLGETEKAEEYFNFGRERCEGTLTYYHDTGIPFRKAPDYKLGLRMLLTHYNQSGNKEKVDEINAAAVSYGGIF